MDVSSRTWWVKSKDKELGPFSEDEFQERLRAGEFSLSSSIKNNLFDEWQPLLKVVSRDKTFRRPSTTPPPSKIGR